MPELDNKRPKLGKLVTDDTPQTPTVPFVKRVGKRLSENYGHVYGIIGSIGVVLAVITLFFQVDRSNGDVHLPLDAFGLEQLNKEVQEYRAKKTIPQQNVSEGRKNVSQEDMPVANSNGFHIVKHKVVVDFNNFKDLESLHLTAPNSAVVQYVTHQIRKVTESDIFQATASTSGFDVFVQSYTPMTVYATGEGVFGPYSVKKRTIEFDVTDYPVGSEFIIQHQKTYWNAFQGEDQSWAGYEVRVPTDEIEYLIIFPENRPFKKIEFFANDPDGNRYRLNRESYVVQGNNKTWIWWRAIKPKPGISYHIDWEW